MTIRPTTGCTQQQGGLEIGRLTKLTNRGIFNKRTSLAQILEFSTIVNSQEVSTLLHFSP